MSRTRRSGATRRARANVGADAGSEPAPAPGSAEGSGPSRRDVLTRIGAAGLTGAAAWSAPTIVRLPSSAAAAATCLVPNLSFTGSGGNGWVSSSTGTFAVSGARGFISTWGGLTPAHYVQADAAAGGASLSITKSVTLTGGRTYTVSFPYVGYAGNPGQQVLSVLVNGVVQPVATVDSNTQPTDFAGTRTFSFTPPTTGTYTFVFRQQVVSGGVSDDIAFGPPTILCT